MKLTFVILVVAILQVNASSYAQNINLRVENATLEQVITNLRYQSKYNFLYDPDVLNATNKVSISVKNAPLKDVLDLCFKNQPVGYIINKTNIVIVKLPEIKSTTSDRQDITVTGKVTDQKGEVISGVNITLKGTSIRVITNDQGNYSIKLPSGNGVLIFSYVSFAAQEIEIASRTVINVQLKEEQKTLSDLVVVGYGTQKKVSLTSAVGVIKSDDISRRVVSNTQQSFQGLSPGLTILDKGGAPGRSNVTMRIRGVTTITTNATSGNNNPLILVDGIEQSINNLNPADIESVSVLKDAAATSIYGSRAATGVLLITTKRGKDGQLNVDYNGYVSMQQLGIHPKSIETVDYLRQQSVAYANAGQVSPYSEAFINEYANSSDRIKYPLANDWYNVLYNNALQYNNSLTISGGSKQFKGLASIRQFQQDGILKNFDNNVKEMRVNTDFTPSDKFKFSFDANYRKVQSSQPARADDVYFNTLHGAQLTVPRYPDGGYGVSAQGNNPLISNNLTGFDKNFFDNLSANLRGEWNILKGLKLATQYGITSTFERNKTFVNAYTVIDQNNTARTKSVAVNALTEARNNGYIETINTTLAYKLGISNHTVNLLAGYSQIYTSGSALMGFRNSFYNNDIQALTAGAAGSRDNSGADSESGLRSYFVRVNYDYAGKYLLELNGRYDGSSNFTGNNLYSFFPSFSAGWRVSQESFWEPVKATVSEFKLRGSFGNTGNQTVKPYSFYNALGTQNYNFNGQSATGYALLDYANQDIKWETTQQFDIGFEAGLFNNKLTMEFDYYNKKTSGILLSLPIPGAIGLNTPVQNAGKVSNKGWELGLNYHGVSSGGFKYDLGFNISDNRNKVLDLKGTGPYIEGSTNDGLFVTDVGLPIGALWGFKTNGFYKDAADVANSPKYDPNTYPGDLKYVDLNRDGKITADDRTIIGDPFPHYSYGFTTNLQYKNFDLYLQLQGVMEQDARISGAFADAGNNQGFLIDIEKDYWTPENTGARFPRPQKFTDKNAQISDFWVVHLGYFKLKNIQIGYTLPESVTNTLKIKKARLYLGGTNLFTISKANEWGIDAEFPTGRGNYYPQTRVYTFGASINF